LRAAGGLASGILLGLAMAGRAEAELPPDVTQFCDYLMNDLKYFDTAERHLQSLRKVHTDAESQGDIAYYEVDLLRLQNRQEAYLEKLAEVQKRFPNHRRSAAGDLPKIGVAMDKALQLFTAAKESSDPEKTASLRAEAKKKFLDEVQKPLDALIASLDQRVGAEEKLFRDARRKDPKAQESEALIELRKNRDFAELTRVKVLLIYARQSIRGIKESEAERDQVLKRGLDYATQFVEDRPEFKLMQYTAQLHKGLFEYELGRMNEAIEDLTLLIDLHPDVKNARSVARETIDTFRDLNIQALLFAAKAYIKARQYEEAAVLVETKMLTPAGHAFDLSTAESHPSLQKYFILAQLERAIALAGKGEGGRALEVVEGIIKKYGAEANRTPPNPLARAYVTDARKALGTLVEVGGITLSGLAYYEGGLGLYSEFREEEALALFQLGLGAARSPEERAEVAPLCLDKIGEINFRLGRFAESAMAYLELAQRFPESTFLAKAAQNAVSASTRLLRQKRDHAGYQLLDKQANEAYERADTGGLILLQAQMASAQDLERQGNFAGARDVFLKIPVEHKGEKVPFYWRAQVSALYCVVQPWLALTPEARKSDEATVKNIAERLEKAAAEAAKVGQADAIVLADFYRGQIYYELKDWAKAAAAFAPFLDKHDAKDDATFRLAGRYYLTESLLEVGEAERAEAVFAALQKEFPDEISTQLAAQKVADFFAGQGGPESLAKAAGYTLIYARHPQSAELRKDARFLLAIVQVLIQGGLTQEADGFLTEAEKLNTAKDPDLVNGIALQRARFAMQKEDYDTVISSLIKFLESYDPQSVGVDDPYIFQMYAEARIRRNPSKPEVGDMQKADVAYGYAVKLIHDRSEAAGAANPHRRKMQGEFWRWMLEWLKVKQWLAQADDQNALQELLRQLKSIERLDMGGEELKAQFLELRKWAEAKFEKIRRK
jgi:TolA-binding protein